MALTNEEWNEIAVLYKVGEMPIRDIAAQFGITHGAIQQRAKRENWERGSLKTAVNQLAKQTSQISHMVTNHEAVIVNRIIKDKAELSAITTEITSDAVQLQRSIVSGTLNKLQSGVIDEMQAAKVLQSLGLTFDLSYELFGANNDLPLPGGNIIVNITPVAGRVPDDDE